MKTPVAFLLLAAATPLRAGTNPFLEPSDAPSGTFAPSSSAPGARGWGFNLSLGYGGINGDFSTSPQKPVSGDFGLFRVAGPWWFGTGLSFGSFVLRSPPSEVQPQVTIVGYPVGDDWAFHQIYLSAAGMFRRQHAVQT